MKPYETDGQLKDLMREIEEKQRRLINDHRGDIYTDNMGTVPTKPDGTYDGDRLTLVDIKGLWDTLDFIKEKEATFSREDIPRIMDAIPSFIACMRDYDLDNGVKMTASRFALWIAERVGAIPVERHIARHHAKTGDTKENAIEGIELTKALIDAFRGIENEDLKALIVYDLVYFMPLLEKWRDGIEEDEGLNEAEEGGREAIKAYEYKKTLSYAQSLGVETALIDRANRLKEEAFSEIKDIIGE